MQLLTALLSCLLSLLGGDGPSSHTRIVRASENGVEVLLSKTTLADGLATFHCLSSRSGSCHYRLYEEICRAVAGTPLQQQCDRRELESFDLGVGARRQVSGLPGGFDQCVGVARDPLDCV